MDVLMCVLRLRIAPNNDFTPRNAQVYTDLIDVALLTRLPSFDNDTARDDPIEEPLEGIYAFSDPLFNGGGRSHMAKRDLYGHLHRILPPATGNTIRPLALRCIDPARGPEEGQH
jgi:hypothetical protein